MELAAVRKRPQKWVLSGQQQGKSGSLARTTFCKNVSVVVFNDLLYDGKADARTLVLRVRMQPGKELENFVGVFLVESYPVI